MKEMSSMYRNPVALIVSFLTFIAVTTGFIASSGTFSGTPSAAMSNRTDRDLLESDLNPVKDVLLHPRNVTELRPNQIDAETLWLARAIFSETKRPEEQLLVAWVVRNRVETQYRGKKTYHSVILDPYQFSAFRAGTAQRSFYLGLNANSDLPGWKIALKIAYDVRHLDKEYRPFSEQTRHFYSERSMRRSRFPAWADGEVPVRVKSSLKIARNRFRFFEGIS